MIESVLTSRHHHYVVFFKTESTTSVRKLFSYLKGEKQTKIQHHSKDKTSSHTHIQLEIDKVFGNPVFLAPNATGRMILTRPSYWYDLFMGEFIYENETIFFITYPYSKIGKSIELDFRMAGINAVYLKPQISKILPYLQRANYTPPLNVSIIKYSAEVKEDLHKINIIGPNPLKSKVFLALDKAKVKVDPIALKLRCTLDAYSMELAFDRLGNYRFWLRNFDQINMLSILPSIYEFFQSVDSIEESIYISSYTLLEDNEA